MMNKRNNWLMTAVQIGLLAWSGTILAADQVYVANEGADTVSVLDAASLKTLSSVRVGKMPHNVQVSPDGKLVWVTNNGEPGQAVDASAHKGMAQGDHDAMGAPGAVWAIDTATNAAAKQAAELTRAGKLISVAGGGDTVAALNVSGAAEDFTYISTAGGAFLEWMEGKVLPGVAALASART